MNSIYLRFLNKYVYKYKLKYIGVFIIILMQNLILISIPFLYSNIIDTALTNLDKKLFLSLILFMFSGYILNQLLNILKDYLINNLSENISLNLRKELNNKISTIDINFFDNNLLNDVISKYDKEISTIKSNFGYMIIEALGSIVKIIITFFIMLYINSTITFFSILIICVYFINLNYWGKKIKSLTEKNMNLNNECLGILSENFNNSSIIKLFNAYTYANNKFISRYKKYHKNSIKLETTYSLNINISIILLYFSSIILWLMGGLAVISNKMSIGMIIALGNYQSMLLSPIQFISEFFNSFQSTKVSIERLYEILDYNDEATGNLIIEKNIKSIKFKDVCFSYNNNIIFDKLNANFKYNKITGILGVSGCGKSTLTKILTGLYKIDSGEIYIDTYNIKDIDLNSLRENITLISQEPLFFQDSIINNINIEKISEFKDILYYSEKLDLNTHINKLSDKWNYELNSNASNLSTGQRKRLNILRAILRKSKVFIFDEATSNLDNIRRNQVINIIKDLKKDSIIIIISHNLDDLNIADDILVFNNGKLININDATNNDTNSNANEDEYLTLVKRELLNYEY